jgi:hypothetical protein
MNKYLRHVDTIIINCNAGYVKHTSIPSATARTGRDARNVANRVVQRNVPYPRQNQRNVYTVEELHRASYRGCKIYQEIIRTRFAPPPPIASTRYTNIGRQENGSPAAPQTSEGRPKITYARPTRNSTETAKSQQIICKKVY